MDYRKIRADRLFDGYSFQENKVLVIKETGEIENVISTQEAGDGVENLGGMLTPGFVNCHCHLELSHMKGLIPEGTGLVDFVFKIITERHHSDEEIREAASKAEKELVSNGVVAVGDICNNALTINQKQGGRLQYYNFIEASGWLPAVAENRFARSVDLLKLFHELPASYNKSSMVPHAPYSVSNTLWNLIQPYFQNKAVSIHNQESLFEDVFFELGQGDFIRMYERMKINNDHHIPTGKSSLQSYFPKLSGAYSKLLVHNTFTRQEDIDFIKMHSDRGGNQTHFCICANANLYIEGTLPPIQLFRNNNCQIVLGTDSLASNWSLSILDEIKTIRKHLPDIPLEEILQWATLNGARALTMDKALGSFEKGKHPGIVHLQDKAVGLTAKRII